MLLATTFDPGHEGEFMLRIFTESDSRCKYVLCSATLSTLLVSVGICRPLVHAVPPPIPWYRACCSKYPRAVVAVEVKGCDGLERQDISGGVQYIAI